MAQKVYEFDRLTPAQKEEIRVELARSKGKALFVVHPLFSDAMRRNRAKEVDYKRFLFRLNRLIKMQNGLVFVLVPSTNVDMIEEATKGMVKRKIVLVPTDSISPLPVARKNGDISFLEERTLSEVLGPLGLRRASIAGEIFKRRGGGCVWLLNKFLRIPFKSGLPKTTIRNGRRTMVQQTRAIQTRYVKRAILRV